MTDQELIVYFETATLPETPIINRAITQFAVKDAVQRNIEIMGSDPKNEHAKHRLMQIVNALKIHMTARRYPTFNRVA